MVRKPVLFLSIICSILLGTLGAMEMGSPTSLLEVFPLQEIIALKDSPEEKLRKLQTVVNFLVFHAETYQNLKNILSVMEVLHELQPYRIIDGEGKQFLSAFRVTDDENTGKQYSEHILEDSGRKLYQLNVYAPEAAALALQIGHFLDDWKLKSASKVHLLDRYMMHAHENIRAVAGFAKHYVYSYQLAHLIFSCPAGIAAFTADIIDGKMDNTLISYFELDSKVYHMVMQLPYMREIIVSTARLFEFYRASGVSDDFFEIYIGKECVAEIDHAKTLCREFEPMMPKFQKLYDAVRAEISRIILLVKDKDKQKQFRREYNKRYFQLFNTNASKPLNDADDLLAHYTVNPQLPLNLDYKVKRLAIFAPEPDVAQKKKSFLPQALSQSAPNLRKKASGKNKNKSRPGTRPNSPNLQIEGQKTSPDSPPEVVQGVIARFAPLAIDTAYDQRVLRWFDPDTEDKEVLNASRESIEYHCFTRLVDAYLFKHGIQTPWKNQTKKSVIDTNYSLGGTIEDDNQSKRTVVFTCCKGRDGVCYHRGFDKKDKNELFEEYFRENHWKVFHRDEFPQLGEKKAAGILENSKEDEVISEDELCVKIRDNHLNMNIVLYKPALN